MKKNRVFFDNGVFRHQSRQVLATFDDLEITSDVDV